IEHAPFAIESVRAGAAGDFRVADKERCAVAGHVEFRKDANAAVACVRDQVANLFLGVVEALGALFLQLRELLAFNTETLIVRQMEMKDVHLDGLHAVEIALENIDRNEVAAHVDEQTAPGEARLVLDGEGRSGKAVGSDVDQLKEGLQTAKS